MFADYISLMLINTMIAYFLLAGYVYSGMNDVDQGKWAIGFMMTGFVSLVFGAYVCLTWPLPGPFNMAYGEMPVLLGIILLGAGSALAKGWDLLAAAWFGFFAGWAPIIIGVQLIRLKLTSYPMVSGIGFILSGAASVLALRSTSGETGW